MCAHLKDLDYFARETTKLLDELSNGKRGRARRKLHKKYPKFIFYEKILGYAARLNEYGVNVPANASYSTKLRP